MDRGAENYQRNKHKKRTVPVLDEAQTRQLLDFLARDVSHGEIFTKLDLSEIDLSIITARLKIESREDAAELLLQYEGSDEERERVRDQLRAEVREQHKKAEDRLDQKLERDATDASDREVDRDATRDQRQAELTLKDEERQRKHVSGQSKTKDLLASFRVPSTHYVGRNVRQPNMPRSVLPSRVTNGDFRQMLMTRGRTHVRELFEISDKQIQDEMNARRIVLEFELLPR